MTKSHHFQAGAEETKKLRKMSGEEGITVKNLKEEAFLDQEKIPIKASVFCSSCNKIIFRKKLCS